MQTSALKAQNLWLIGSIVLELYAGILILNTLVLVPFTHVIVIY